jgi:hypothetical protein
MSLFIPAVFKNITEERIISAFKKVKLGKVSRVNFLYKNEKFNSVHICFSNWSNTDASRIFKEKTKTPEGAKLVYDDPWHWIVLEYNPKYEKPKYEKPKYVEVSLKYVTEIEDENDYLKDQLYWSDKKHKNAIDKIKQLEEQLIQMETKMRECDHISKIYTDEIISLKQKIVTIEEDNEDERRAY